MKSKIKIAVAGVGNCASSLIQGIAFYSQSGNLDSAPGLIHRNIGSYQPGDIQVVAAFDIDARKVGQKLSKAIFQPPNCTHTFCEDLPQTDIVVDMGRVEDGVAPHMEQYDEEKRFVVADHVQPDQDAVVKRLKDSGAEMLLNYMPVGAEKATRFYAQCCLEAGIGFINNMPVFIASAPVWAERFKAKNLPIIGDDVKSQLGATIVHRTLVNLFRQRGVQINRTYQLNTGGNTDFLNMLDRQRLSSKKISKTEAVQSMMGDRILEPDNIHIGPSDYVPWQKDNKVCFIRMEGHMFGQAPVELELRLSVEDSPDSAGVVIDAVRCMKLALDRGQGGILIPPSACFMKHPPRQYSDEKAVELLETFIAGEDQEVQ